MTRIRRFGAFTFALMVLISCKKQEGSTSAKIEFFSPLANDTLTYGQELHLEGKITGEGVLNGYTLAIKNATNNVYLIPEYTVEAKEKAYVFHEHLHNEVSDTSTIEISVNVPLSNGAIESKKINVVFLPQ
jgi:hypothetical protein